MFTATAVSRARWQPSTSADTECTDVGGLHMHHARVSVSKVWSGRRRRAPLPLPLPPPPPLPQGLADTARHLAIDGLLTQESPPGMLRLIWGVLSPETTRPPGVHVSMTPPGSWCGGVGVTRGGGAGSKGCIPPPLHHPSLTCSCFFWPDALKKCGQARFALAL